MHWLWQEENYLPITQRVARRQIKKSEGTIQIWSSPSEYRFIEFMCRATLRGDWKQHLLLDTHLFVNSLCAHEATIACFLGRFAQHFTFNFLRILQRWVIQAHVLSSCSMWELEPSQVCCAEWQKWTLIKRASSQTFGFLSHLARRITAGFPTS